MAETTDRPEAPGQVPPDAVMPAEQLGAVAPATVETYQPLSLLALAGFALAVIYSFIVLIGAAISLFGHFPWLMQYWTFLIPLAAVVICWAARTRIRNSEGTLSGLGFTTWGSRLAILVGLTYAAYYIFTFFAVRLQAIHYVDSFFQDIKQGQLEQAFLLSQGVSSKGMSKKDLRDTVELRFNQAKGRPGAMGPFTNFRHDSFVRFIEMDGDKASVTPRGVVEWEYKQQAYHVVLNYHIATSLVEFDVKVDTVGHDPKPGEGKGRQWQLNVTSGFVTVLPDSKKMTPQGEEFVRKAITAQNFVMEWTGIVNGSQWKEAYLDTLQPAERERLRKDQKAAPSKPLEELAKLIRIDDAQFWAGKKQRDDVKERVRKTFQLGASGHSTFNIHLQQQPIPIASESDGRTTAIFDVNLFYLDEAAGTMQYQVDARIVVSADSKDAADSTSAWRVEAIDIDAGRSPPMPTMQTRPPPDRNGLRP